MPEFSLLPFPGQNSGGISIQGVIERTPQTIALSFLLQGNLHDIVLPDATERTRCDNLWQATCFEMFWTEEGAKNYWEMNLAPTGAWNIYAFSDYRTGMRQEDGMIAPVIATTRTPKSFTLTAELDIASLHAGQPPLRVGISGVLAHRDTRLSYWALAHPDAKPNFHTPQAFLLRL
jgi:hypothetical protein